MDLGANPEILDQPGEPAIGSPLLESDQAPVSLRSASLSKPMCSLDIICPADGNNLTLDLCPTVMPMLKGVFWLIVLLALIGFHSHLIALILCLGIVGLVAKMFFAPFVSGGKP